MGILLWLLMSCAPDVDPVFSDKPSVETTEIPETIPVEPPEIATVTDVFEYQAPVVDVLWVIDASGSMVANTEVLQGSLDNVIDDFLLRGFNFHVGATTIDESFMHGRLTDVNGFLWADDQHPSPGNLLVQLVDQVGDPSSNESGREAAYRAIEMSAPGLPNEGFLRDNSQIAVVVHTDESDQSGQNPIGKQEFIDYLIGLRPAGDVAFHSLASSPDYFDVTNAVGGVGWSVDNTPYGPALRAMTDMIVPTTHSLSETALEETMVVLVIEPDLSEIELAPSEFIYDPAEGKVLLVYIPDDGATVEITYEPVPPV